MESDTHPSEQAINKEISLAQGFESGWDFFIVRVSKLGKRGKGIQRELTSGLSFIEKRKNWKDRLNTAAKKRALGDDRLNETEARVALMTGNACYFRVLKALGEEKDAPQGYIKMMEGLQATLPWNRTGFNPVTLNDVTQKDLDEALDYINKSSLDTS